MLRQGWKWNTQFLLLQNILRQWALQLHRRGDGKCKRRPKKELGPNWGTLLPTRATCTAPSVIVSSANPVSFGCGSIIVRQIGGKKESLWTCPTWLIRKPYPCSHSWHTLTNFVISRTVGCFLVKPFQRVFQPLRLYFFLPPPFLSL